MGKTKIRLPFFTTRKLKIRLPVERRDFNEQVPSPPGAGFLLKKLVS
jgi:hypothetical protein